MSSNNICFYGQIRININTFLFSFEKSKNLVWSYNPVVFGNTTFAKTFLSQHTNDKYSTNFHWRPGGRRFNPNQGRQHSFLETDHEIFSTVILSLPLIQEGQLSVSGERMCTILVNGLED